MLWRLVSSQVNFADEELIRSPWFPVEGRPVELGQSIFLLLVFVDCKHPDDRQIHVKDFRLLLVEAVVASVPSRPVNEEAVDVNAFTWLLTQILAVMARHLIVQYDFVQSPAVVHTRHFLPHCSQEPLRIEEAGDPETKRPLLEQPIGILHIPVQQLSEPEPDCESLPGRFDPKYRHLCIIEGIEGILKVLVHDDRSLDGHLQVPKRRSSHADHLLHPVHFLFQTNRDRVHSTVELDSLFDFEGIEVIRHLLQHIVTHPGHDHFPRFSSSASSVFRLNVDDCVQHLLYEEVTEADVGVRVKRP